MVSGGQRPAGEEGAEYIVGVERMRVMQATNQTLWTGGASGSVSAKVHQSHSKALAKQELALCGTIVQTCVRAARAWSRSEVEGYLSPSISSVRTALMGTEVMRAPRLSTYSALKCTSKRGRGQ